MKLGRSIGDFAVKLPVVGPVARTLRDHGRRFHRPTRAAGGNSSSMPAPTTSATFSILGWRRSATRSRTARRILPIRLSIKRDTTSIVWLYEKPDTSTFRYRVYTMEEALASDPARRASAAWFAVDEIAALLPRRADVDTLVLARVRYDADVARPITAAKSQSVRILFDCDDLVLDTRYVHLLLDTLDQDTNPAAAWDGWFASIGRIEATARLCDGAIATNHFLAEQLAETVPGPVCIVPNFLNRRQQNVSVTLVRCPARYAPLAEANAAAVRDAYGWNQFADRILEATVRND